MVNQFVAALKGDDAAIEAAQLNLSFCYITAPFDGRVGLRQVDPGNLVHAADPGGIVTITQVHPITVVFTLPQADLPAIVAAMGQRQLEVAAWSSDDKTPLAQGTLLTPDNAIDTTTGTIRLKATLPEPGRQAVAGAVRRDAVAAAHRAAGGHRADAAPCSTGPMGFTCIWCGRIPRCSARRSRPKTAAR